MTTNIDRDTYNKAGLYLWNSNDPNGSGYWPRFYLGAAQPKRIVVHTTNGNIGSSFEGEAAFLYRSLDVSVHYLVGKAGQCARFLVPRDNVAWAVGEALPGWSNAETINIECHYTPGEQWTDAMHATLSSLVLELAGVYPIGDLSTSVATHRAVALPPGRKEDPSGWSDLDFGTWRANLQCQRSHP